MADTAILPLCAPTQCGKEFRETLHRPSPNSKSKTKIRLVPAFTYQALQKNTCVYPPPKCDVFSIQPEQPTQFRKDYTKGDIPAFIEFTNRGKRLVWKIPIEKLDFRHYLPLFFDALTEKSYPYTFVAENGIIALFDKAPHKVLPCVPVIIYPLKRALDTKDPEVLHMTMRAIRKMVLQCENVGEALVPYYRVLLPIFNLFINKKCNLSFGNVIERKKQLNFMFEDTLNILEKYGGPDAYINIKYYVPLYESMMKN